MLVSAAALAFGVAAPADAAVVVANGMRPDAVVDRDGVTHLVWNERPSGNTQPDVLHYCQIPMGGTACEHARTFVPNSDRPADNLDSGSHVMVTPFGEVILLTPRCCAEIEGRPAPAQVIYTSEDGGLTFGPATVVGTTSVGSARAVFDGADRRIATVTVLPVDGVLFQAAPLGQWTQARARLTPGYNDTHQRVTRAARAQLVRGRVARPGQRRAGPDVHLLARPVPARTGQQRGELEPRRGDRGRRGADPDHRPRRDVPHVPLHRHAVRPALARAQARRHDARPAAARRRGHTGSSATSSRTPAASCTRLFTGYQPGARSTARRPTAARPGAPSRRSSRAAGLTVDAAADRGAQHRRGLRRLGVLGGRRAPRSNRPIMMAGCPRRACRCASRRRRLRPAASDAAAARARAGSARGLPAADLRRRRRHRRRLPEDGRRRLRRHRRPEDQRPARRTRQRQAAHGHRASARSPPPARPSRSRSATPSCCKSVDQLDAAQGVDRVDRDRSTSCGGGALLGFPLKGSRRDQVPRRRRRGPGAPRAARAVRRRHRRRDDPRRQRRGRPPARAARQGRQRADRPAGDQGPVLRLRRRQGSRGRAARR